jgi:hypothetical protein
MTSGEKEMRNSILNSIEDQIREFDNAITRDTRALQIVSGLIFDEELSNDASLLFENLAQSFIQRRLTFLQEEREHWTALSDELYKTFYNETVIRDGS